MAIVIVRGTPVQVDDDFTSLFEGRMWRIKAGYVIWKTSRRGVGVVHYLHRVITGVADGLFVDHINGDKLDNRRINLRIVTRDQNAKNVAGKARAVAANGFKGLKAMKNGKYEVRIRHDGRQLYLGTYASAVEAAYVYDMASIQYHGEYGRRNFLPLVRE